MGNTDNDNKVVCIQCGVKYLTEKQKAKSGAVTANLGICCECGDEKPVVSIRHYNNLKPMAEHKAPPIDKTLKD